MGDFEDFFGFGAEIRSLPEPHYILQFACLTVHTTNLISCFCSSLRLWSQPSQFETLFIDFSIHCLQIKTLSLSFCFLFLARKKNP